jgi:hypothetical protein
MRLFSYLYHGILALFLLGISAIALSSGHSLHLRMLPWTGQRLAYWLLFSALAGLILVVLAIRRTWRALFFLWSLVVLVMMVRGYFFSSYYFRGKAEFHLALYLILGALIALCGAWFQLRREPRR